MKNNALRLVAMLMVLMMACCACAQPAAEEPAPVAEAAPAPTAAPAAPAATEAPAAEPAPAVVPEAEAAPAVSMKAGTYTAKAYGFNGELTVSVTVSETEIKAVELVEHNDTAQQVIAPATLLPERIIASQSVGVDTITGATYTSSAMLLAVMDCLEQAGADLAAFRKPVEKSDAVEEYEAELVVVGAGATGCAAAMQAVELGVDTILLEKAAKIGGTSSHAGGVLGANPKKLLESETETPVDTDALFRDWFASTDGFGKGNIIRNYIDLSGSTIDWLETHGFKFEMPNIGKGGATYQLYNQWVGKKEFTFDYFTAMRADYEEMGGKIFLETDVDDLLYDENGNIAGVTATRYDGTTVVVKAKAVMLATGGMGANKELQSQLYDRGRSYEIYGMHTNTGDGITWALENGADVYNVDLILCHTPGAAMTMTTQVDNIVDRNITFGICAALKAAMRVNYKGERFANEANDVACIQQGGYHWVLISQSMVETLKTQGFQGLSVTSGPRYAGTMPDPTVPLSNIENVLDIAIDMGFVFKADTIEDLAEQMGVEPVILRRNFDRYEEACMTGVDTYYGKDASLLVPYGEGPYYALKAAPKLYTTVGGLDVDEDMCVLRTDGSRIDGLYAGGAECMGVLFGALYQDLGGPAMGWCFNSGRMAAFGVAEYLGK